MTDRPALILERDQGVLTLINNDPPINRMTFAYMDEVEAAVEEAATDPSIRALVFTAAGTENFSVGMDLKQLQFQAAERGGFQAILDQRRRVLHRIENLGKPSIAMCASSGGKNPCAMRAEGAGHCSKIALLSLAATQHELLEGRTSRMGETGEEQGPTPP